MLIELSHNPSGHALIKLVFCVERTKWTSLAVTASMGVGGNGSWRLVRGWGRGKSFSLSCIENERGRGNVGQGASHISSTSYRKKRRNTDSLREAEKERGGGPAFILPPIL